MERDFLGLNLKESVSVVKEETVDGSKDQGIDLICLNSGVSPPLFPDFCGGIWYGVSDVWKFFSISNFGFVGIYLHVDVFRIRSLFCVSGFSLLCWFVCLFWSWNVFFLFILLWYGKNLIFIFSFNFYSVDISAKMRLWCTKSFFIFENY